MFVPFFGFPSVLSLWNGEERWKEFSASAFFLARRTGATSSSREIKWDYPGYLDREVTSDVSRGKINYATPAKRLAQLLHFRERTAGRVK